MKTKRRHGMRCRLISMLLVWVLCAIPVAAQLLPPPISLGNTGNSAPQRFIVRAPGGISVVQTLCGLLGCSLLESLGDPASQVFVISTSVSDGLVYELINLLGITHIEV